MRQDDGRIALNVGEGNHGRNHTIYVTVENDPVMKHLAVSSYGAVDLRKLYEGSITASSVFTTDLTLTANEYVILIMKYSS